MVERYVKQIEMESATLAEIIRTNVFPAIEMQISRVAEMVSNVKNAGKMVSLNRLEDIKAIYENLLKAVATLEVECTEVHGLTDENQRADRLSSHVLPAMLRVRELSDEAEGLVADDLWPLPKYRELLFLK
jgi:glutamine synthetase